MQTFQLYTGACQSSTPKKSTRLQWTLKGWQDKVAAASRAKDWSALKLLAEEYEAITACA